MNEKSKRSTCPYDMEECCCKFIIYAKENKSEKLKPGIGTKTNEERKERKSRTSTFPSLRM